MNENDLMTLRKLHLELVQLWHSQGKLSTGVINDVRISLKAKLEKALSNPTIDDKAMEGDNGADRKGENDNKRMTMLKKLEAAVATMRKLT